MEGKRRARERQVTRSFECNRLQDELWNMAYEHVWPLFPSRLSEQKSVSEEERTTLAKGA